MNADMLEWHDCKTDPPKESGPYVLKREHKTEGKWWFQGWFDVERNTWYDFNYDFIPYPYKHKWAKIELEE